MITKIIVTIQHSIKSQIVWLLSAFPPDFSPDSSLLLFCDGTNTDGTHKTDLINGYDMVAVEGPCLTLASDVPDSIEMIGHGTLNAVIGTGTATYDGTDLTVTGAGTFFRLEFSDGTIFPCSEGAGDDEDNVTIHDTTGQHSATITVADTPLAMWTDNTQDVYMDGHDRGWHEIDEPDDDGIYYPADPNTQEIYNLALEVTGLGTVTIDSVDYTVGSHQLTDLTGSVDITAAYGLDEDALDWSGGDTVTGDYPDYSVDMSISMSIVGAFSVTGGLIDDPDIQGLWYFENNLTDETANGNDLTQSGSSLVYDNVIYQQGAYSATLTTLADTLDAPGITVVDEFTVGGWVYKIDYDNWESLFSRYAFNDKSFDAKIGTLGQIGLLVSPVNDGTGSLQAYSPTNVIPTDSWSHIVFVYDGTYLRVYFGGTEYVGGDFPMAYSAGVYSASGDVKSGQNVTGNMDEFFIFNRALTPAEISDIYTGGF